jgi:UDP-N-acetylglucosamine 1-carboxyvinyltransferase
MDKIRITGGNQLFGHIPISGAKNAALPLMIASLLTDGPLVLDNLPRLADVAQLMKILRNHGVEVTDCDGTLSFSAQTITSTTAPYDLVSTMRASFWVIGPLLARCGQAEVSLPGGCAIGTRPVDLFLMGLEKLGAEIAVEGGNVIAKAPRGLRGARIVFPKVSVGATHTLLMAATLAKGETVLENAAREPEIGNLAACLIKMGAKIEGLGTQQLTISGVDRLNGTQHAVLPDRIETGTYAFATAMTGGDVTLQNTSRALLEEPLNTLINAGAEVTDVPNGIRIKRAKDTALEAVDVTTAPFPGFPTDLQAQFMALMTRSLGTSKITETIFENRFMHVAELARFGAQITVEGDHAVVTGVPKLYGAPVMATDLRASVSLVIAGLAAEGETTISRIYHLDRGFERLEEKLRSCGAQIERVRE